MTWQGPEHEEVMKETSQSDTRGNERRSAKKVSRRSKSETLDDLATMRFKELMKKNAGKHRFERLDEGDPPPPIPRASARRTFGK